MRSVDCIIATNFAPLKGVPGRPSARSVCSGALVFHRLSENWSSRFFDTLVSPKTHLSFSRSLHLKHRWGSEQPKTNSL